jgi:hypothetical protein
MNMQVKPEAFFDSLSLAHKLDNYLDGFRLEEIHLFSYFSTILFLYKSNNVSDWGYRYTLDNRGYPFSDELNEAIKRHLQNGLFEAKSDYFIVSGRGADEYNKFKLLPSFIKREEFLNAACTTTLLVPYSQTLRALLSEPEIQKAKELENNSWLEQSNIYQKFKEISESVGVSTKDLLIPAVTWVNYLSETKNPETE